MANRKTGRAPRSRVRPSDTLTDEIVSLKRRLEEAEEALDAVRTGSVDALVVNGPDGDQIYTLKDADRPYRAVLEHMRDGAVTIRPNGLILYANRQFAAMMGLPLESILSGDIFALAGSRGRADLQALVESAGQLGAHGDIEFVSNTGRPIFVRLSLAPIRMEGDAVLAGVAADISEEKQMQRRIRQIERTEALGRLAGGVAHDLNNILQPVIINAELLLEETDPASPKRDLLNRILEAAARQKELIQRILTFTRGTKQALRPLAVTPLVVEASNLIKPSLPRGVAIRVKTESSTDVVHGDPTELHELVTNLITNAADAMGDNGGTIEVSLRDVSLTRENSDLDLKPGRYLKLVVQDTGRGIAPEDMDRIFDPFFTTKDAGRGTGLGLTVVQGIVKSYSGSITVNSRVGKGTEVAVFLPVADPGPFPVQKLPYDWRRAPLDRRILVVDDEDIVLDTLRRALASFGHKPTAFNDARGALALVRSLPRHFDLAIIDQTMPRMSGLELAAAIRKINPDMPILIATGYSKAVDEHSIQDAGVTAVVMKPFSLRDLAAALDRALAGRHKP